MSGAEPRSRARRWDLLWTDGTAGTVVGVAVLALNAWLPAFWGLPRAVVLVVGAANLGYGLYALSLAARRERPAWRIRLLVAANAAWVPVALTLALAHLGTVTAWGAGHLVGEAVFVGGLAVAEWRARHRLRTAPAA